MFTILLVRFEFLIDGSLPFANLCKLFLYAFNSLIECIDGVAFCNFRLVYLMFSNELFCIVEECFLCNNCLTSSLLRFILARNIERCIGVQLLQTFNVEFWAFCKEIVKFRLVYVQIIFCCLQLAESCCHRGVERIGFCKQIIDLCYIFRFNLFPWRHSSKDSVQHILDISQIGFWGFELACKCLLLLNLVIVFLGRRGEGGGKFLWRFFPFDLPFPND